MPRKKYVCKNTKRSFSVRKGWDRRRNISSQISDSVQSVRSENTEEIFEKLLQQSRSNPNNSDEIFLPETQCNKNNPTDSDDSDLELPKLLVEPMEIENRPNEQIAGRRLVNVNHIFKQFQEIANHSRKCTMGKFIFQREIVSGFFSKWIYFCDNCEKSYIVTSESQECKDECNDAFVWGALSIGIGYAQAQEMFTVMDVPVMGANKFRSHERKIGKVWEETLLKKMKENSEEEKRVAIEKGNYLNGLPYITVIGDGGWAKRSYGHGMNSASGVGAVIGAQTKKLLFLGVRNKFCFVCSKNKKKADSDVPAHDCYLNYKGASTGMESSVIVEAFQRSEEDYGMLYKYYIGDGDSSVFTRIQERCKYGRFVRKIECANHMTRCLNDKLHKLSENTTYPIESRKLLTATEEGSSINRLERLVKGVRTAIKRAGQTKNKEDVLNLQKDVKNSVDHVFGKHDKCSEFCKRKGTEDKLIDKLDSNFLIKIRSHLESLQKNAETLILNQTTNVAEQCMGIIAKFTGGKRVNFSSSGSYKRRCYGAGLSHSKGPSWHLSPWKVLQKRSPGKVFKARIRTRENNRVKRALLHSQTKNQRKRKRRDTAAGCDADYGPLTVEADIDEEEMKLKSEEFLKKLEVTAEEANIIETDTVGQHDNLQWHERRMNRLTASRFGVVVKRLPYTSCHNLVKSILYPKNLKSDAITFGKQFESVALEKYENIKNTTVKKCGLFIDQKNPFLGATPDGLVETEGLVEVKCLYSVGDETLREVVGKKKPICLEIDTKTNCLSLKINHDYYYQIQGQLNICKRNWCDFIVYTRKEELFVQRIERNEEMWKQKMLPKIVLFFKDCILPEIIDSRIVRGLKIRDPLYILEAQEIRLRKKSKQCVNNKQ